MLTLVHELASGKNIASVTQEDGCLCFTASVLLALNDIIIISV